MIGVAAVTKKNLRSLNAPEVFFSCDCTTEIQFINNIAHRCTAPCLAYMLTGTRTGPAVSLISMIA